MNKIEILTTALEYIEANLSSEIKTEDVAGACYCSKAALEKLFRCINHMSVHDYVVRRRMTLAARRMRECPEVNVLEVALAYGYSTNESFSRAFKKVWDCNPSEFKENPRHFELFPRRYPPMMKGDAIVMARNVDISELYELFKTRKNCYFMCCDIDHLVPINEISHKAGDMAILESLRRMEAEAGEEDVIFRIGGDEFAMLTSSEDATYAEAIAERIRANNGKPIVYEGREIPLKLHIAVTKSASDQVRYKELFEQLHNAIMEVKR
ncbi:MAG: helix-turn-helix domain-containing protein [Lachnospiraceae bacterium]|nr:helix-turn-helix domain-containing protein [Lachnospiraceae bacterium]